MKRILLLIACIFFTLLVGISASYFTKTSVNDWFVLLKKPNWQPPNTVFAPVWTILYILMGVALWNILDTHNRSNKNAKIPLFLFFLQLILNFLWSYFFFYKKNIYLGLIDLSLLWILVLMTTISFWKYSKLAGILLLPYLIWTTYAWSLNFAIFLLNR